MKNIILFLVFSISISSSLFAQKNANNKLQKRTDAYVQAVEGKITLTSEEKEKIISLKKEHLTSFFKISTDYKGKPELKEKRKEANKQFSAALNEAFGKERAKEIINASKKNNKKKKKKKKTN